MNDTSEKPRRVVASDFTEWIAIDPPGMKK